MTVYERLKKLGVMVPDVLLPAEGVDYGKYAVIACDQFSAQPQYWDEVTKLTSDAPSARKLILPEAYLHNGVAAESINAEMQRYLDDGTLVPHPSTCVLVRRQTTTGVRSGLVLALDLEQYDFSADSTSLIRATEQTVVDRLPPRIEIRRGAPLEMPHVMVLINDRDDALMSALFASRGEKLYDFELMMDGGHIEGYAVNDERQLAILADNLERLARESDMVYAMGDGNHSFAAAKKCWELLRDTLTPEQRVNHPARFSLVELVNLYDPALDFEPIHRVFFNVDADALQREVGFDAQNPPSLQDLQPKLDVWLKSHPEAEIEYIHGEDECRKLGAQPRALAVIFPSFDKESLFDVVRERGCFVRKSFSMGAARDKRYYLEAKRI